MTYIRAVVTWIVLTDFTVISQILEYFFRRDIDGIVVRKFSSLNVEVSTSML